MPENATGPDPRTATCPTGYVALLRQVRCGSGLTYREISRRARETGKTLPPSTLANMLGRNTLPRAELVVTFLTACGTPPEQVASWVDVRRRIAEDGAAATATAAPARPSTVHPPSVAGRARVRRWRPALAIGTVALLAIVVLAWRGLDSELASAHDGRPPAGTAVRSPSPGAPAVPAPGYYLVRAAHSSLCLTERVGTDDRQLFQSDCARAFPPRALRPTGAGHRFETLHPEFGPGCMGVVAASRDVGGVVQDGFCGTGLAEEFRLEPVTTPASGFRIHAVHSGLCVGVVDGSTEDWAPVRQVACDLSTPGQIFTFDTAPAPSPAASGG
ncbi:helix-turn-helix domain-containing protein [Plantactinospora sp. CA-294935]|uniref:helix-turn-helix domain-containing protein n=1 Tax=Plantactinospora sp. CA-294935 TaxID=3240012 RepID=UPI003D94D073